MPRYQNNMCEWNKLWNNNYSGCFCIKYHLDVLLNIYILARPLKTTHFEVKNCLPGFLANSLFNCEVMCIYVCIFINIIYMHISFILKVHCTVYSWLKWFFL